jgi:hypothetical protein
MATNSKKPATSPVTATATPKKPVAKKSVDATVVAEIPASKVTTKKSAAAPLKKTAATPAKKSEPVVAKDAAVAPSKNISAPKAVKPAGKPVAVAKSTPAASTTKVKVTVTAEQRYQMVATAAYFRAEQRGFATGHEAEDWKASEAQIDAMLKS